MYWTCWNASQIQMTAFTVKEQRLYSEGIANNKKTMEELKKKWGGSLPQIGDYVFSPEKAVYLLSKSHIDFSVVHDLCDPIPLTTEVLERIKEVSRIAPNTAYIIGCGYFRYGKGRNQIPMRLEQFLQLQYFHQLQQLYRLLTRGKELNYKPWKRSSRTYPT